LARSLQDITNAAIAYINSLYPNANTFQGTLLGDIVIGTPAQEEAKLYAQSELVSQDQSIDNASSTGLNKIGGNYNTQQKSPIPAVGAITFFTNSAPATDIDIPVGTVVGTGTFSPTGDITFSTTREVVMYAVLGASYLNPNTGKYEITTEIEAITAGSIGNVAQNTLNTLIGALVGIDGCYNANSTTNGVDTENIEVFRRRLSLEVQGNTIGTPDGFLTIVLQNPSVGDAILVGNGNTLRDVSGAVDIYIKGVTPTQYNDSYDISLLSDPSQLIFTKQPIYLAGVQTVIISNTGSVSTPSFTFVQDSGSLGGSIYAQDKLVWATPLDPSLGTVYINYSYNSLPETLQNQFAQTNFNVLNTDLLVKSANQILIDITTSVKILPGFDNTYVALQIQSNIAEYLDSLQIGATISQSGIALIILQTPGINDVLLPFTSFSGNNGLITPDSFGDLDIPSNSYAEAGDIVINVVV
jgi:uncharacterized phage protein gp47/JayE